MFVEDFSLFLAEPATKIVNVKSDLSHFANTTEVVQSCNHCTDNSNNSLKFKVSHVKKQLFAYGSKLKHRFTEVCVVDKLGQKCAAKQ